jgi:hypothetical protein
MHTVVSAQARGGTVSVYFNPGSNGFSVKITEPNNQIDKIVVMNLIGRELKSKEYVSGQDIINFTNLDEMPNGIYVVIVKDKNNKIIDSAKLVISK